MRNIAIARPNRRIISGYGQWEYLRPTIPYLAGTGVYFDPFRGISRGTYVNTAEPPWGDSINVPAGATPGDTRATLQSMLTNFESSGTTNTKFMLPAGDEVIAGTVYIGTNLSNKYIGLYSQGIGSLPAVDAGDGINRPTKANRVNASYAPYMTGWSTDVQGCLQLQDSNKVYCRGMMFNNRYHVNMPGYGIVNCTWVVTLCSDVVFQQCGVDGYDDGVTYGKTSRAYILSGYRIAVVNSFADHGGCTDFGHNDSQAVLINFGNGPYKIANNDLCWDGDVENIMSGGSPSPSGSGLTYIPIGIEVTGNHLWRRGTHGQNKPWIESKFGYDWLVEGNICHEYFNPAQADGMLFWATDQITGNNPYACTRRGIIMHNKCYNSPAGINISARNYDSVAVPYEPQDFWITNNEAYDIGTPFQLQGSGLVCGGSRVGNIQWYHNTCAVNPLYANYPGPFRTNSYDPSRRVWGSNFCRNVLISKFFEPYANKDPYYTYGAPAGTGEEKFAAVFDDNSTFLDNLVHTDPSDAGYAHQIRAYNDPVLMGLTDYNARNFRLTPGSIGSKVFNGGTVDAGVDYNLLDTVLAGVR